MYPVTHDGITPDKRYRIAKVYCGEYHEKPHKELKQGQAYCLFL